MRNAVFAGLAYFAFAFGLGFLLGTIRVLFLAPRLGEGWAVALELPVMLGASYLACRFLVRAVPVAPALAPRAAMGGTAFGLLMIAEFTVGLAMFGRSPAQHFALYAEPAKAAGLAAQIVFATFPLWIGRRR
jgi:hypothetical protein